jgi:hypothetical protein
LKEVRARKEKLREALDEGRAVVSENTLRANLSEAEVLQQCVCVCVCVRVCVRVCACVRACMYVFMDREREREREREIHTCIRIIHA